MNIRILAGLVALACCPVAGHAETPAAATDFTKADLEKMLALGPVDHQGKVVDAGQYNVGISVVIRTAINAGDEAPVMGLIDTQTTKIYTIVAGSGVLVTGGHIVTPKPVPPDLSAPTPTGGATMSGANEGGVARPVVPGDVIIIPVGVFAGWKKVPDRVSYTVLRVDPARALTAGYVNAALTK